MNPENQMNLERLKAKKGRLKPIVKPWWIKMKEAEDEINDHAFKSVHPLSGIEIRNFISAKCGMPVDVSFDPITMRVRAFAI